MNQFKVNQQRNILALFQQGWSKRRIARDLGLDRATARKHLAGAAPKSPPPRKPARARRTCAIFGGSRSEMRWSGACPSSASTRT